MNKRLSLFFIIAIMTMALAQATTLSIIPKEYVKYDGDLRKPAFLVTMRGQPNDDYLVGTIAAEGITATDPTTSEKIEAGHGFTLEVSTSSKSCNYPLKATVTRPNIVKTRLTEVTLWTTEIQKGAKTCMDQGAKEVWVFCDVSISGMCIGLQQKLVCAYEDTYAVSGDLQGPTMDFESVFTMRRDDGKVLSDTIKTSLANTRDVKPVIQLGEDAIIKWIGGTTFGEFCPITNEFIALQRSDNNQWITADSNAFEQYRFARNAIDTKEDVFYNLVWGGKAINSADLVEYKTLISNANRMADAALNPRPITFDGKSATVTGSVATLPLRSEYMGYVPDFQAAISADFLTVVLRVAKPAVRSVTFSNCLEGATNNYVDAVIENAGTSSGSFFVTMSCEPSSLKPTSTVLSTNLLEPGKSQTVRFPFNVELSSDAKGKCTVTAVNTNYRQYDATDFGETQCYAQNLCGSRKEGDKYCIGTSTYICTSGQPKLQANDNYCKPEVCCNKVDDNGNGFVDENCESKCICDYDSRCEAWTGESPQNCDDCVYCNANKVCEEGLGEKYVKDSPSSCSDCNPVDPINWLLYGLIGGLAAVIVIGIIVLRKNKVI